MGLLYVSRHETGHSAGGVSGAVGAKACTTRIRHCNVGRHEPARVIAEDLRRSRGRGRGFGRRASDHAHVSRRRSTGSSRAASTTPWLTPRRGISRLYTGGEVASGQRGASPHSAACGKIPPPLLTPSAAHGLSCAALWVALYAVCEDFVPGGSAPSALRSGGLGHVSARRPSHDTRALSPYAWSCRSRWPLLAAPHTHAAGLPPSPVPPELSKHARLNARVRESSAMRAGP